ncbi:hypothetical protein CUAC110522_03420 [Cutibacterium acnes subsp. acnes]
MVTLSTSAEIETAIYLDPVDVGAIRRYRRAGDPHDLCADARSLPHPVPHHVQSPGVNTMLVMADLIRLMGLATPIAVDVESMYFVAEGWELIDPPPKSKCVHT